MKTATNTQATDPQPLIASLLEYAERFADLNGEPTNGECRRTIAAAQAFLAPAPKPGEAGAYYPELGEDAPDRLFHAEHNFRSTYSLCWKAEHDAAARAKLRELNIRPGHISRREPGEWLQATRLGGDVFACLITSAAHKKLRDAGVMASRMLLD